MSGLRSLRATHRSSRSRSDGLLTSPPLLGDTGTDASFRCFFGSMTLSIVMTSVGQRSTQTLHRVHSMSSTQKMTRGSSSLIASSTSHCESSP